MWVFYFVLLKIYPLDPTRQNSFDSYTHLFEKERNMTLSGKRLVLKLI